MFGAQREQVWPFLWMQQPGKDYYHLFDFIKIFCVDVQPLKCPENENKVKTHQRHQATSAFNTGIRTHVLITVSSHSVSETGVVSDWRSAEMSVTQVKFGTRRLMRRLLPFQDDAAAANLL